jgi:hypothetical protein
VRFPEELFVGYVPFWDVNVNFPGKLFYGSVDVQITYNMLGNRRRSLVMRRQMNTIAH